MLPILADEYSYRYDSAMAEDESIGGRIKRLRLEHRAARTGRLDWTQAGLAAQVGVEQGAVSKWETGRAKPDPRALFALAEVLGVKPEELVKGTEVDPNRNKIAMAGFQAVTDQDPSAYNLATQSAHAAHAGGIGGEELDPLSRAALSARLDKQPWKPPRNQQQFGRDLVRTAVFIAEFGRALASGQVAIVSNTPPVSTARDTRPRRRVPGVPQAKKRRA